MNADLAVVLSPGAEQAGLGWLLSWLGWLAGLAGMKINCFLKQFIGFLSHRRGSGTRAQNRLGWAGLTKFRMQRAGRFRALRPRPSGLWGRSQQYSHPPTRLNWIS